MPSIRTPSETSDGLDGDHFADFDGVYGICEDEQDHGMFEQEPPNVPSEENDDDGSSRHRDQRENEGPLGEMSRARGWLRKITELFLACTIGLAVRPGGR